MNLETVQPEALGRSLEQMVSSFMQDHPMNGSAVSEMVHRFDQREKKDFKLSQSLLSEPHTFKR